MDNPVGQLRPPIKVQLVRGVRNSQLIKAVIINGKRWDKDEIWAVMERSDAALINGFIKIYDMQTTAEQSMEATVEHNGVGFTGADGDFMTSLGNQYYKKCTVYETYSYKAGVFTDKQIACIRKNMKKYSGQLFNQLVDRYQNLETA